MATQLEERPETKEPGPLAVLRSQLEKRADEFRMVLPAHISPEKLQRTILTAAQTNPALLHCERRSFLTACMKAAQDGLLPDGREAAIVPFKRRFKTVDGWQEEQVATYMPMVYGLRKKILQSEEVADLHTDVVYRQEIEAGRFVYEEGTERQLRHKPIIEPDFRPTDDDIALAYSVATLANGFKSFEVLRRWQIDEIRECSQTGALYDSKGRPREPSGPWVDWFAEQAKKSAMRRHSKSLPMSSDVFPDVEAEDMAQAARSAVALLDSSQPDAPKSIAGPASGFSVEGEDFTKESLVQREPEHDDPDDGTEQPPSGLPGTTDEPQPAVCPQPPDVQDEGDAALTEPPQPAPVEPPTDEYGMTKDPDEVLADELIAKAKRCELLIDFKKLEKESLGAIAGLGEKRPELAGAVEEEFARARLRLNPKSQES